MIGKIVPAVLMALTLGVALALAQVPAAAPTAPPVKVIAPNVYLLPGALYPDRGSDGNTVLFTAPGGVVVVDTGRHVWHSDAIAAFARTRGRTVVAIFNTHWHLDHASGNRRLAALYPDAPVYTTNAIDRAVAEGGFLHRNLAQSRPRLKDPALRGTRRGETENFIATMDAGEHLRPDRTITRNKLLRVAGRSFDVRVTDRAVTDADVWLYDPQTHVAVIGDLVTLPAPFFETACPDKWSAALDEVWATPFRIVIPGHGEPMTRAQFDLYRGAFNAFKACVWSESG